jgi:cell division protein FtsB
MIDAPEIRAACDMARRIAEMETQADALQREVVRLLDENDELRRHVRNLSDALDAAAGD